MIGVSKTKIISILVIALFFGAGSLSHSFFIDTVSSKSIEQVLGGVDAESSSVADDYPPVARFNWTPEYPCIMQVVTFDGSASYEPFGFIISYEWSYTVDGSSPVEMGSGKILPFLWTQSGVYNVTLTVTDDDHQTDSITKSVYVSDNQRPTADFTWVAEGLSVTFTDTSRDDGEITFRGWDFNDDGAYDDYGDVVTHVYPSPGTYDVTLVVQDDEGLTDNHTEMVTVTADDIEADLVCDGTLQWINTTPGGMVTGSFSVSNEGDAYSLLDWRVDSHPVWGNWTFTPENGVDLEPSNSPITVVVTVVAPDQKQASFNGTIIVVNEHDETDYCELSVVLTTPKNQVVTHLLSLFFEQHPRLFSLMQRLGLFS
jgi:PKD repeat protein